MRKVGERGIFISWVVLLLTISSFSLPDPGEDGQPLSPTGFVIDELNGQLIVAHKTGLRIDFVESRSGQLLASLPTPLPPTGICLSDQGKAYVTCSYSNGLVLELDAKNHKIVRSIDAGHGANSPVLSPDSHTLYVANQYDDDVSVIDLQSLKTVRRIGVRRQPMAMDITPDGRWLFVANLLPAGRADRDTVAAEVTVIGLPEMMVQRHLTLANGSNALRGIRVAPDGEMVFVSHNLGRFQVPTSQLEQGWMNTSALSIIGVASQEVIATILLDEPENGAAGSWGVDLDDEVIAVAHSGTHDYSLIQYGALKEKLRNHPDPQSLSYDLSFLRGIRKRYPLAGEGPRAIRLNSGQVFTALYFSDAIQVDDYPSGSQVALLSLNWQLVIDSIRLGEMAFNDARFCFQQWQSCAGCHPNDARTDALNWDLLNDGLGNPKNCKSMLLAHLTPPSMITGIRANAETAVRAGFRHIQFTHVEEGKAQAVDQYLQSLEAVPSPHLVDGKLSKEAQKGKKIFIREECISCHPGPWFTDRLMHKIGVPGPADRTDTWDTPTLIEVWRTAPYLHDGRSATMEEVFTTEKHGISKPMKSEELKLLIAYVLSL
jgi:YVTN family beta-propeller protein